MPTRSEAEDNLRVIRSLMERATIYRAVSAPVALIGGLISVIICLGLYFSFPEMRGEHTVPGRVELKFEIQFFQLWFCALAITLAANTFFIWLGARQRNEPFFSAGMKLALLSLLPALLCAAFFTLLFLPLPPFIFAFRIYYVFLYYLPTIWMLCYGLGLLATGHFAPRSIAILGWTFLFSGFVAFCLLRSLQMQSDPPPADFFADSNLLMGLTFGLFHVIYAVCTWPRKSSITAPAADS